MTRQEAMEILERYHGWNMDYKGVAYSFSGEKDSTYEAAEAIRNLIIKAANLLAEEV